MGRISHGDLICKLKIRFKGKLGSRFLSLVGHPFEHMLRFDRLRGFRVDVVGVKDRAAAAQDDLAVLDVDHDVSAADQSRIPREGPVVVLANHPFGGVEPLVLATVLGAVRKDVKVVADRLSKVASDSSRTLVLTDPLQKTRGGRQSRKECIEWVRNGGMLVLFPARGVSQLNLKRRAVIDPKWRGDLASLIRQTGAPALPIFFNGCNSALFQVLTLINSHLSSAMLPRELFKQQRKEIRIHIGRLIPFDKLATFRTDKEMTEYLRMRTYMLGLRNDKTQNPKLETRQYLLPIAPPQDPDQVADEVRSLPSENTLAETGGLAVLLIRAEDAPCLMQELGRLREITFREVGEGTGKGRDLDRFDHYYRHLIVWNKEKNELVGAYRLGLTDEILPQLGKAGLYTSSLFKFKPGMLREINPAVELGRSFVRAEYQKSYAPLMLLWKGIGRFVVQNPRYKLLFGPVSINEEYNSTSRQLMIQFLRQNNYRREMAKLVKARRPIKQKPIEGLGKKATCRLLADIEEVSELVSDIEADQKGVPILLRQYLRLGGKLLGCNIDPDFSNVLDALIIVDLTETDPRILIRYVGKDDTEKFLACHGKSL